MRKDKEPPVRRDEDVVDPQLLDVERSISSKLATKVKVNPKNIQISYSGVDDLNRILEALGLIEE